MNAARPTQARPTPRQRAVLEAMRDGTALRYDMGGWFLDDGSGAVHGAVVNALWRRQWIKRIDIGSYTITEAGRRAVARSDGGA